MRVVQLFASVSQFYSMLLFLLFHHLMRRKKRHSKKLPLLKKHLLYEKDLAGLFWISKTIIRNPRIDDVAAFERVFRIDLRTFHALESVFRKVYNFSRMNHSGSKNQLYPWLCHGRPSRRFFTAREILLTLLRFLAVGPSRDDLSLLTSATPSTLSKSIRHGLHVLLVVLQSWTPGRICLPSSNERALKLAQNAKTFLFEKQGVTIPGNFIGALDGKIVESERPSDHRWQNTIYNGYYCVHAKKVLLLQLFDGTYGSAVINFIGSAHDSKLASKLKVAEMMSHLDSSFCIVGDSAFATSPRVVRSLTDAELRSIPQNELSMYRGIGEIFKTLRVSAEWGVGAVTKTFQVLEKPLPADDICYGKIIWEICLRLYNVRVRLMKKGEVFTVFENSSE